MQINGKIKGTTGPLEKNSMVIGTVGRMAAVKNPFMTLLQCFYFIVLERNSRSVPIELRLVMIGDGPLRRRSCAEIVDAAGIQSDRVWLPGERDDVADLMAGFDIFVNPVTE